MNTVLHPDDQEMSPPFADLLHQPGTYALDLEYRGRSRQCRIGAIGSLTLRRGTYIYVGSAAGSGGLAGRLGHHVRGPIRPRWHVDYLSRDCHLAGAWITLLAGLVEHRWAQQLARLDSALLPMRGFGASDCRCCRAHLIYFANAPAKSCMRQILAAASNAAAAIYVPRPELDQLLSSRGGVSQSGRLTGRSR